MRRKLHRLERRRFDIAVVGGGIFGVCCAWEAAARGLSVALLEKADFAHATSANHFKIIHGGIRYLQHLDVRRIRESYAERTALLRIAPHLCLPLPILLPAYGHGLKGRAILRAGFLLYDMLTWNRSRGIPEKEPRIPSGRILSRDQVTRLFPDLKDPALTGGAVFTDGQIYNPPRLAISFLRSAVQKGAEVANYVEVTDLVASGGRVTGLECRDLLTGRVVRIRATLVVNAAGPWANDLLERSLGLNVGSAPTFSRDVAIVVSKPFPQKLALARTIESKDAEAVIDRGGRHLFFVPWRNYTLVGVWHRVHHGKPDKFQVTAEDLRGFIKEAREAYPSFVFTEADVSMVNTGLILFGDSNQKDGNHRFGKRSLLIDHSRKHKIDGLITLIGVRATMARAMAEKVVDLVLKKLRWERVKSKTAFISIFGGDVESFSEFAQETRKQLSNRFCPEAINALLRNYGSSYADVLGLTQENPSLGAMLGQTTTFAAEVVHAVRCEMAEKLADVVFRRTDLGTGGYPGEEALQQCARLVAGEKAWDESRIRRELEEVESFFEQRGTIRDYSAANGGESSLPLLRVSR